MNSTTGLRSVMMATPRGALSSPSCFAERFVIMNSFCGVLRTEVKGGVSFGLLFFSPDAGQAGRVGTTMFISFLV